METHLNINPSTEEYDEVSWNFEGRNIVLEFPYEINAIYSESIDRVVVEKYEIQKIGFYFLNGRLDFDVDIPALDGYQFRGIKKNAESKTGVSLLFFPIEASKGNQWKDMEQYELVAESQCLGKYLNIYR